MCYHKGKKIHKREEEYFYSQNGDTIDAFKKNDVGMYPKTKCVFGVYAAAVELSGLICHA